jgi:hypothetical protein
MKHCIGLVTLLSLLIGVLLFSSTRPKVDGAVKAAAPHDSARPAPPARRAVEPDKPGTINGAQAPDLIPDRTAYLMLFRLLAGRNSEVEKNRAKAYIRQIYGCTKCSKLSDKEQEEIDSNLEGLLAAVEEFDREVKVLDQQAKAIKDQSWPNPSSSVMAELTRLQAEKEKLIDKTVTSLSKRLTLGGRAKLKQHIDQQVKRKIKLVPSPQSPPSKR